VWQLWKRATAWLSSESIVRVNEAMDWGARAARPWRVRIWYAAWLIAIVAYLPFEILIGVLTVQVFRVTGVWESLILFGPICTLLSLFLYCMVRSWFSPAVPPGPWVATTAEEQKGAQERAARSYRLWYWVAGILTAATIIGRIVLQSR
jgi:hypothetical protein